MYKRLSLEEKISLAATALFIVLGLLGVVIQNLLLNSETQQQQDRLGHLLSQQAALYTRFDTFNKDTLSLAASVAELANSGDIAYAAVVDVDGGALAEAGTSDRNNARYSSPLESDGHLAGYALIELQTQHNNNTATQLLLLFAATLVFFVVVRLAASRATLLVRNIRHALEDQDSKPHYSGDDELGELLATLFPEKPQERQTAAFEQLGASIVVAIRIANWDQLRQQLDERLLEQISAALYQEVIDVNQFWRGGLRCCANGYELYFEDADAGLELASNAVSVASLLMQHHAASNLHRKQQRNVTFNLEIGILDFMPPGAAQQQHSPHLLRHRRAACGQLAAKLAQFTSVGMYTMLPATIRRWQLQHILQSCQEMDSELGPIMLCQGLKPPYQDLIDEQLAKLNKA